MKNFILIFVVMLGVGLVFRLAYLQQTGPVSSHSEATEASIAARTGAPNAASPRFRNVSEQELRSYPERFPVITASPKVKLMDVHRTFEEHYPKAMLGNADSMYWMSVVTEHCIHAGDFIDDAAFYEVLRQIQVTASPEYVKQLESEVIPFIDLCKEIGQSKPDGLRWGEWSYQWLQQAAESGDHVARLSLLNTHEPASAANYVDMANLLEANILNADYRTYYQATLFYTKYRQFRVNDDPEGIEFNAWWIVGCRAQPECSVEATYSTYEEYLLPSKVERIRELETSIQQLLDNGKPIPFRHAHTEQLLIEGHPD